MAPLADCTAQASPLAFSFGLHVPASFVQPALHRGLVPDGSNRRFGEDAGSVSNSHGFRDFVLSGEPTSKAAA